MKSRLHICYKYVGGLDRDKANSLVFGSISMSSHEPRLVDSVGVLLFLTPPPHLLNYIPDSSTRLPKLCLMFGCVFLHLFPSAAG